MHTFSHCVHILHHSHIFSPPVLLASHMTESYELESSRVLREGDKVHKNFTHVQIWLCEIGALTKKRKKLLGLKMISVWAVLHTSLQYWQWTFFPHKILHLQTVIITSITHHCLLSISELQSEDTVELCEQKACAHMCADILLMMLA